MAVAIATVYFDFLKSLYQMLRLICISSRSWC